MKVEIYGHSDDCIEVEGGDLTDEFSAYDCKKFLHFSDGTIIEAEYSPKDDDDYRWRVRPVKIGKGTTIERVDGTYHGEDDGAKCDRLILSGAFDWVRCYGSAEGPTGSDIEAFFANLDYRDLSKEQQRQVMAICQKS